jgi:hypothetical protein
MFSDSTTFDFNILGNDDAFTAIQEAGLHYIRCSESGQIVAVMSDDSIQKAIEFEVFQNPTMSVEEIVDSMQMRWFIQSSRPAPHLTAIKSRDSMLYLHSNHPLDAFAILVGRMLFDSPRYRKQMSEKDARFQKMLWLTELDNAKHRLVQAEYKLTEKFTAACEALIRIDAIHDVRQCLYTDMMRETAELIRDNPLDLANLLDFIAHVESDALEALTKMKRTPQGNRMSMSAASVLDIDDELVTAQNDSAEDMRRANLRKIEQAQLYARQRNSGTVQVIRGKRPVVHLAEITGVLPPELAAKYKIQAKGAGASKAPTEPKAGKSKKETKVAKALARFGNLNLDF